MLKKIMLSTAAACGAAGVNAFGVEPNLVVVRRFDLPVSKLPKSFANKTIAHISDLHCSSSTSKDFLLSAIEKMNSLEPDFVILTGDYTTRYDRADYFDSLYPIFAAVKSRRGSFACFGNHDYGLSMHSYEAVAAKTGDALAKGGIKLLRNSSAEMKIGSDKISIIGLGDVGRRDCYPKAAFDNIDQDSPRIVIAHSPDSIELCEQFDYDAFLCGHTHGGQVCLPFYGPIIVPSDDKRFKKGLYSHKGRFVYVNSGLATLPTRYPGPRFLCPPEITLYRMKETG